MTSEEIEAAGDSARFPGCEIAGQIPAIDRYRNEVVA